MSTDYEYHGPTDVSGTQGYQRLSMALIDRFGEMWARNAGNIEDVPGSSEGGQGVYILYDGSTPVCIGRETFDSD